MSWLVSEKSKWDSVIPSMSNRPLFMVLQFHLPLCPLFLFEERLLTVFKLSSLRDSKLYSFTILHNLNTHATMHEVMIIPFLNCLAALLFNINSLVNAVFIFTLSSKTPQLRITQWQQSRKDHHDHSIISFCSILLSHLLLLTISYHIHNTKIILAEHSLRLTVIWLLVHP